MTSSPSAPAVRLAQVASGLAHPPPVDQDGPEVYVEPSPRRYRRDSGRLPTERFGRPRLPIDLEGGKQDGRE